MGDAEASTGEDVALLPGSEQVEPTATTNVDLEVAERTKDESARPNEEPEEQSEQSKDTGDQIVGSGSFICEADGASGPRPYDVVRSVFKSWGWQELPRDSSKFDVKWACMTKCVFEGPAPSSSLVNHFKGAHFLSNKALLAQCLNRCPACADKFFPRQYNLCASSGLRSFLADHLSSQAGRILHGAAGEGAKVAARVLSRLCPLQGEAGGQQAPLLHCPHECESILGPGCHLPTKRVRALKPLVDTFLHEAAGDPAACAVCKTCKEDTKVTRRPREQLSIEGEENAWVVKDPCIQRGRGVTVAIGLRNILTEYERVIAGEHKVCVVQKYIERPLLVQRDGTSRKADLRAWVAVLDWNPLTIFALPQVYFRIATKPFCFNAESMEANAHKTNCRDEDNRVPLKAFLEELGQEATDKWTQRGWPLLLDAVRAALLAARDGVLGCCHDERIRRQSPRAFELFGFDFALDEDWRPWLLEANISPNMLEDCTSAHAVELVEQSKSATRSLLTIAVACHRKQLQIPTAAELVNREATEEVTAPVERLFSETQTHAEDTCYGAAVAQVPACLVRGLQVHPICGDWLLVLRQRAVDEASILRSYRWQQKVQPSGPQECTAGKVLRDWLLPLPSNREAAQPMTRAPSVPKRHKQEAPSNGNTEQASKSKETKAEQSPGEKATSEPGTTETREPGTKETNKAGAKEATEPDKKEATEPGEKEAPAPGTQDVKPKRSRSKGSRSGTRSMPLPPVRGHSVPRSTSKKS
mmetsp:Transcript_26707/g.61475  ORF Transcript_26707/g.61475 Transcript_26707/m.61475 type:complete len:757 (-) Transcript_26707:44-2314(-)